MHDVQRVTRSDKPQEKSTQKEDCSTGTFYYICKRLGMTEVRGFVWQ
jgi:hypothetical protein